MGVSFMAKYYGKGRKTMGKIFRTKKGRVGCYVYLNGRRVGFEEKPRYSKKNYNYPKRRY